ncbi:thiosulfate dehydrogenase [Acidocella aromatica]|uniref:Transcriptional initiation protein Tat n=1 Tax=Acidocella aromatica TaxID=1303579 RepID=A0A840VCL2_9PROT|nr:transcriptional initiation protein Tat [Acidocella aromatica]MBB5373446.1 hypothetical protein [Acidocella aromatica]
MTHNEDNVRGANRRALLSGAGLSIAAAGLAAAAALPAHATEPSPPNLEPNTGATLAALTKQLAILPRRRQFSTVPMILTDPAQWDSEALNAVLAYRGGPKQVWDNTDLAGPWLNLMRNSLNVEIYAWKHPDFLIASATHASAHLALYDQTAWDKYKLAAFTGGKFSTNTLIETPPAAKGDVSNIQNPAGPFSPAANSIAVLQQRGVVFLACHNAIWELSGALLKAGVNPGGLSHEALAADLTNHLIPGAILSPGTVGTIPELQRAGFHYAVAA